MNKLVSFILFLAPIINQSLLAAEVKHDSFIRGRYSTTAAIMLRKGVTLGSSSSNFGGRRMILRGGRRHGPLAMTRSAASILSPLKQLANRYSQWLLNEPVVANLVSGTIIVALGDAISQMMEVDAQGKKKCSSLSQIEARRVLGAGLTGVVFNGCLLPQWYVMIHKILPVETPKTIAAKILGNCVAWGCIGNGAIMLMRRMLDGESFETATAAIKRDLWGVMKTDYKIWPFYDILCFTMIPRHVQSMCTGALGVGWAAYLSYVTFDEQANAISSETKPNLTVVAAAKAH